MTEPASKTAIVPAAGRAIQEVPPRQQLGAARRGIIPQNIEEVWRIAKISVSAGLMKHVRDGDPIAMAAMIIMKGDTLGLDPSASLDSIALINGRTCVYGKAIPALVRMRGHKIREWETGTRMTDDWTFHCEVTRGDTGEVITRSFSVLDAKQAGLWTQEPVLKKRGRDGPYEKENDSPWYRYPQRMLPARAKGYAVSDGAPEALLGMYTVEEMQDVIRAEEMQAEERGALAVAPPPPAAEPEEAKVDPGEGDRAAEQAEAAATSAEADTAELSTSAVDDAPTKEVQLAAVSCATAMSKAKSVDRLDKLMEAFNTRFDGDIPRGIASQLELIYERNKDRIEGS